MKVWVITNGPVVSGEDTAYLIGRLAMRTEAIVTTAVDRFAREAPEIPGDVDVIFNRMRGTAHPDFLTSLQNVADGAGVPVTNPGPAAIRSNDKRTYLADFPDWIPDTRIVASGADLQDAFASFGGDIVVKSPSGFGGKDVHRISGTDALSLGTDLIAQTREGQIIVQPFLSGFAEGDLRLLTARGDTGAHEVIGAIKRTPAHGQWKCSIHCGGTGAVHAPTDTEIQAGLAVAEASGLDYTQLDFGWHSDRLYLIETNQTGGGYVDFDFGNRANSGDAVARMIERMAAR